MCVCSGVFCAFVFGGSRPVNESVVSSEVRGRIVYCLSCWCRCVGWSCWYLHMNVESLNDLH
jgi:hypothetical protein